ncbi:MAG: GntR family transcriptional regulator [Gemmatimonadaceae bacterium]|jgi:DNA-binding GntR family transcriptional regulator|nr:GntR family transcriptional regulator [Gemmatimonadaceae bacterium]
MSLSPFLPDGRPPGATPDPSATDRLRTLIVTGVLAPASRVTEPEVAARLGVSRTPAREAMHQLQMEGLLVGDGGGARPRLAVAPLDAEEARAVYEATGLLEGAGARTVAEWAAGDRRALAQELRRLDTAFRKVTRHRVFDPGTLFAAHHAFHVALVDATADRVTRELLQVLSPRRMRYEWFHGPLLRMAGRPFAPTYDEHHAIVDAIADGTARDIEQVVRGNWSNAAQRLADAILGARAVVGVR